MIDIESPYRVEPGKKINLDKFDTADTGKFKDKKDAREPTEKNLEKLDWLQELLYASAARSVLIVFQAMDAGGKDGAIDHVFSGVNPQGCSVTSFKAPSTLEHHHDFLWRHHLACPARGMIGIHNRSHYEAVLVERVKSIVPEKVWRKRYEQINDFERMLTHEGTVVLKFFLHISRGEQKKRLQSRLDDPEKHWKFDPNDLVERKRWGEYMDAFADALRYCSTDDAPWFIVPSDHKWYRNWVLSDTIVRAMELMRLKFPKPAEGLEKIKVE